MIPDGTISQTGPLINPHAESAKTDHGQAINAALDRLLLAQQVSDLDRQIQCLADAIKFSEEAIYGLVEQKYFESFAPCPLCGYEPCYCDETSCYEDWEVEHCWVCGEPLMSHDVCPVCGESEEGNWVAWLE
ncbi:MAG: hypothetical protein F4Z16_06605 [Rhodothermaceae bacterium]|nr:hypothetical protein [Rhodothermaceae bacterium]MYD66845.1 hypothetical protein [Rhodothermaceae bacterium]